MYANHNNTLSTRHPETTRKVTFSKKRLLSGSRTYNFWSGPEILVSVFFGPEILVSVFLGPVILVSCILNHPNLNIYPPAVWLIVFGAVGCAFEGVVDCLVFGWFFAGWNGFTWKNRKRSVLFHVNLGIFYRRSLVLYYAWCLDGFLVVAGVDLHEKNSCEVFSCFFLRTWEFFCVAGVESHEKNSCEVFSCKFSPYLGVFLCGRSGVTWKKLLWGFFM